MGRKVIGAWILINLAVQFLNGQVLAIKFPRYCDFIYTDENGLLFVGSNEGLYVGQGGKLNRIGLNLNDEENIQSSFFKENNSSIWFSTYTRIINLNLIDFSTKSYRIQNSNGDTLRSDYHLFFAEWDKNRLWAKVGNEIYSFDVKNHFSEGIISHVNGYRIQVIAENDSLFFITYYYTDIPQIIRLSKENTSKIKVSNWKDWPASTSTWDVLVSERNNIFLASSKGIYAGNIHDGRVNLLPNQLETPFSRTTSPISAFWHLMRLVCGANTGMEFKR